MVRKYILTGGPGTGKSTLLMELHKRGIYAMKEAAEYLIQRGIRPENGLESFQRKLLETQLEWEREIPLEIKIAFSDRGIPDGIAYYKIGNLEPPKKLLEAARNTNYAGIFILDPLLTYQNTDVRRENEETALRIHEEIKRVYEELGYKPFRIPNSSLKYRTEFTLDMIGFKERKICNEVLS